MNTRHMRPFAYFSGEGKVGRVWAGKAQEVTTRMAAIRETKCFSPTRPAMGESALHRPDALAQTDQNVPSARRAEAPYSPFPTLSSTECSTCATLWLSPGNSWANVSASTAGNFSRSSLSPRALA